MKLKPAWLLLALACIATALALLIPSRDAAPPSAGLAPAAVLPPTFPLKGTVLSVETDDRLLLIDHEDIPGFMPAMAMFFRVDAATHKAARAGDRIAATMVRHEESLVLQDVKLIPATASTAAPKQL